MPTDQTEVANSGNVNSGVVNYELGTPSWGQKRLEYQLRSEKHFEELELFVKSRGQSKVKLSALMRDLCLCFLCKFLYFITECFVIA